MAGLAAYLFNFIWTVVTASFVVVEKRVNAQAATPRIRIALNKGVYVEFVHLVPVRQRSVSLGWTIRRRLGLLNLSIDVDLVFIRGSSVFVVALPPSKHPSRSKR